MRIERIKIRNLRAIEEISIDLDPSVTVLVGANNAGKTTILDALDAVLSFRGATAFSELDFRSTDSARAARLAQPINIELALAPTSGDRFDPAELGPYLPQTTPQGDRFFVRLTTRWSPDPAVAGLETTLSVLRTDGQTVGDVSRFPFLDELPLHAFGADRDLQRGLASRWSSWGRIVADTQPSDLVRARTITRLKNASKYLVRNTPGLEDLGDALSHAGRMTGIGSMEVALSAAPQDVDELLRRVVIELKLPGAGRGFGAERHGLGTQGAILFAVYRLHAQRLRDGRPLSSPVMTIEEPEAHLHPTAQRALAAALRALPGQVIIASHSPDMARSAGVPILLRNTNGKTTARSAAWSSQMAEHANALFAKCVLLVEGLEAGSMAWCARALGIDLHERGVEIINVRGQGNLLGLWRIFGPDGLALPTACVGDGDDVGALRAFVQANVDAGRLPSMPVGNAIYRTLRGLAYFVPAPNRNVEEVLSERFPSDVDACLRDASGEDHVSWRAGVKNDRIGRKVSRINARRGSAATPLRDTDTVAQLTDSEARYLRLVRNKSGLVDVLRRLTCDGSDSRCIPVGYRRALRWVERATK